MELKELMYLYRNERKQEPATMDKLLDFCQQKYIHGEIDVGSYRQLLEDLYDEGATSCHELELEEA